MYLAMTYLGEVSLLILQQLSSERDSPGACITNNLEKCFLDRRQQYVSKY